ncbi:hypothetical protein GF337_12180, partial [candidate division KSB1 bacterium]|nr:hypothetical protein [candidate division KSB1 bacterium]
MNRVIILLATVLIMNQFQCGGQKKVDIKNDLSAIKQIPAEKWELLKTKNFYFGHQSVGFNIIEGIELIMLEIPEISLDIKETKSASDFKSSIFAHSAVGENKDPFSKIMDFKNIMHSGVGDSVDYAFFKFCYIDIKEDTDVQRVFATYKKVLDSLEMRFPNTT